MPGPGDKGCQQGRFQGRPPAAPAATGTPATATPAAAVPAAVAASAAARPPVPASRTVLSFHI